jgi:hypothetical protein
MTPYQGGCLCGRVRFRINAPALESGYCHCRMCQHSSGSPVVAWVTFPRPAFAWTEGAPKAFQSSPRAQRLFCGHCGSYLAFESEDAAHEVSVNTTALDEPERFPPRMHIFAASRVPWFDTPDTLPRYPGYNPPTAAGS